MAKIGFIGLGNMGLPMAQNLIKAGHSVTGFDVQPATVAAGLVLIGGYLYLAVKSAYEHPQ
jgi:3-hydroxyisobutyrate dehydrogenase